MLRRVLKVASATATFCAGDFKPDLPTVSLEKVKEHNSSEKGIWVTYKRGVYDVTSFVSAHPGGESKITLAAGASIEPFWGLFKIHHRPEVYELLEEHRIANIDEVPPPAEKVGAYKHEPERHPALKKLSEDPCNAVPPTVLLTEEITPNDVFYVRNHLPVPLVNHFTVEIDGRFYSLQDLKQLPRKTIRATVMCAGNRRSEMERVRGLPWTPAAIGTADWTGVPLAHLLSTQGKHVQFEGLDTDPLTGEHYGASIPFDIATRALLAYEMNGEALPRDHGFPLRVIVPGVVGARNVKFLKKVVVSDDESPSFWQQEDYRTYPSSVGPDDPKLNPGPAIQDLPVTSAILEPTPDAKVEAPLTLRGYAFSGGGRGITRVEVSIDGATTWHVADLEPQGPWAWTLWEYTFLDIPSEKFTVQCRALDDAYNSQPEVGVWNVRGLLNNGWHKVTLNP